MKKLLAFSLLSSSIFFSANSVKADWDYWATKSISTQLNSAGFGFYTYNSSTGEATLRTSQCIEDTTRGQGECYGNLETFIESGNIFYKHPESNKYFSYDLDSDTWTDEGTSWKDSYRNTYERGLLLKDSQGNIEIQHEGKSMIKKKADGSIHIGENSAVFKEEGGREKFWAQDANGKSIPIDITNGSKLLINGRDVEQSINNVGALSAALTGLPMVPTDTTLACGLGTGTHGGDFAFSGGCASKINEKLSINYAASMTIPGQEYAGDFEDQFSARAGFVWKLGKAIKPNQISIKEGKELKEEIIALKENNQNIISQNKALLARLEKLEKIALIENNSKDLAI